MPEPLSKRAALLFLSGLRKMAAIWQNGDCSHNHFIGRRFGSDQTSDLKQRHMREFKHQKLSERLNTAAKAKQAMLKKIRAMPGADDPAVIKRKAERLEIARAREARAAERVAAKEREIKERAELEAREAQEQAEKAAALAAEQKAARDARYAARKKKKKR